MLNEEIVNSLHSPDKELVQGFLRFENELAELRFHRSEESDCWLTNFVQYLQYDFVSYINAGYQFFRARKHSPQQRYTDSYKVFATEEMGSPPRFLSSEGRANPAGIPLLYGASNKETAAIEIRPDVGESLSIATFSTTERIKCLDFSYSGFLRDPVPENTSIMRERSCPFIGMLMIVNYIYSRPATTDPMKYITSQIISEAIKLKGYQAIAFDSKRSECAKFNFVFFDSNIVKPEHVERFTADLHLNFHQDPSSLTGSSTLDMKCLKGPVLNDGPGGFIAVATGSGKTR